jgi:RNA polymerase sigma-70 factor (ECF subfamily)
MVRDFDAWYAQARPSLAAALGAWCGDASIGAEAVDEAFVRALERWDRVGRLARPEAWVWTTAANVARRRMRRRDQEARLIRRMATTQDSVPPTEPRDPELRRALLRLTDRQRTVVVLHHLADLPIREVAEIVGIAEGTVSATLHQARARLAADLGCDRPDAESASSPIRTEGGPA